MKDTISMGHGLMNTRQSYAGIQNVEYAFTGDARHIGGWVDAVVLLVMFVGRSWMVTTEGAYWELHYRYPREIKASDLKVTISDAPVPLETIRKWLLS